MAERIHVVQVGAPDPELRNSPVVEETAEEYEIAVQALPMNRSAISTDAAIPRSMGVQWLGTAALQSRPMDTGGILRQHQPVTDGPLDNRIRRHAAWCRSAIE